MILSCHLNVSSIHKTQMKEVIDQLVKNQAK